MSVVMATYNRSNIIGYSIESLRRNSWIDWELIVVGDACTDDTAAVVASFNDPRFRFVNLPVNHGEQSGPNNQGVKLARGRFIAFLNHDDLWFPGHLASALAALETTGADLVFGIGVAIQHGGQGPVLNGAGESDDRYTPLYAVPATLWVMRRELAAAVGPWRPAQEIRSVPSMDWLHRAWKSGAALRASDHLAAVIIPSGSRRGSYSERQSAEHACYFRRLYEPDFNAFVAACAREQAERKARIVSRIKLTGRKALLALGVLPPMPRYLLNNWRRGAFLRRLRRVRGLPTLPDSAASRQTLVQAPYKANENV